MVCCHNNGVMLLLSRMATKITKWTREKGSAKDFVDATRRSHQPLAHHLTLHHTAKLRELARRETTEGKREKQQQQQQQVEEERESREDAVVRRRIEWLRAQLHEVTLGDVRIKLTEVIVMI